MKAMDNDLHRTDEFEAFFNSCDFIENYGTTQELFYPMLVAWSRGYEKCVRKGKQEVKDRLFNELYARKEMGG